MSIRPSWRSPSSTLMPFFEDCRKLNIKRPDVVQPATGLIDDYIKIITKLLDTGYAYSPAAMSTSTPPSWSGTISSTTTTRRTWPGVREGVEEDTNKRNKNDFVLWFTKSKFEDQALKWDSPWGVGYPGWHIECSGISMKYNGEYLTSTAAAWTTPSPITPTRSLQSESYLGHPWCPPLVPCGPSEHRGRQDEQVQGRVPHRLLLEQKGYDPLAYRFFCLQSHYRKSLVFSWENLDNATVAFNKLIAKIAALIPRMAPWTRLQRRSWKAKFTKAMDNDLNTSMAVTVLYDVPQGQDQRCHQVRCAGGL